MPPKRPPLTLPSHFQLFFILLLYCFVFSFQQVCNHQDQSVLLAFSASIATPPSLRLNWSSLTSCCQWEGVKCDINGRVTQLHLPSRGLEGVIASSITTLTSLKILDLSSNNISGSIPQGIGSLLFLEKLYLYENNLTGPIPSSLMNCTHLSEILLRDNQLSGYISKLDFSRLVKLQKLDLNNNSLSGSLPQSLYSCKSLVAIRVAQNNVIGQISSKIAELRFLSFFSISQNSFTNITATLRVLATCKNLTSIFLSSNFYGESLPVHSTFIVLGEFPKIQFFLLENCHFVAGPIPNWLSNLKSLRYLSLNGNNMIGRIPNWLGTLPRLSRLELNNNSLFGKLPLILCQLPALVTIDDQGDLEFSQFELPVFVYGGNINTYIRFKYIGYYRRLGLSYNAFTGNIPEEIGNLRNLQELDLNNNHFSGHIPISMSNLRKLERLYLSTNNLTGEISPSLASLSFLSHFDVSYNDLEGPIPTGAQFLTFPKSSFEGNPGLCGELLNHPCFEPATSRTLDGNESDHHETSSKFLDGLFVGFASGFSCILVVLVSYVWFNDYKNHRPSSRRSWITEVC